MSKKLTATRTIDPQLAAYWEDQLEKAEQRDREREQQIEECYRQREMQIASVAGQQFRGALGFLADPLRLAPR